MRVRWPDIAFVNYRKIEAAVVAATLMNQVVMGGRPISARLARPRVAVGPAAPPKANGGLPLPLSLYPPMAPMPVPQQQQPGMVPSRAAFTPYATPINVAAPPFVPQQRYAPGPAGTVTQSLCV
jgi:hypothetical protein